MPPLVWKDSPLAAYLKEVNAVGKDEQLQDSDGLRSLAADLHRSNEEPPKECPPPAPLNHADLGLFRWLVTAPLLWQLAKIAQDKQLAVQRRPCSKNWQALVASSSFVLVAAAALAALLGTSASASSSFLWCLVLLGLPAVALVTAVSIVSAEMEAAFERSSAVSRYIVAAAECSPWAEEEEVATAEISRATAALDTLLLPADKKCCEMGDFSQQLKRSAVRLRKLQIKLITEIQADLCGSAILKKIGGYSRIAGETTTFTTLFSVWRRCSAVASACETFERTALAPLLSLYTKCRDCPNAAVFLAVTPRARYAGSAGGTLHAALGPVRAFLDKIPAAGSPRSAAIEHMRRYSAAILATNYSVGLALLKLRTLPSIREPLDPAAFSSEIADPPDVSLDITRISKNLKEGFVYLEQAADALTSAHECLKPDSPKSEVADVTPVTGESALLARPLDDVVEPVDQPRRPPEGVTQVFLADSVPPGEDGGDWPPIPLEEALEPRAAGGVFLNELKDTFRSKHREDDASPVEICSIDPLDQQRTVRRTTAGELHRILREEQQQQQQQQQQSQTSTVDQTQEYEGEAPPLARNEEWERNMRSVFAEIGQNWPHVKTPVSSLRLPAPVADCFVRDALEYVAAPEEEADSDNIRSSD